MSAIAGEALLIVLLLIVNGLFAMSELAIVTARRSRLERRAEGGDAKARAALDLAAEPSQFLSTVQVGITLVSTVAGVFGGAKIADRLAPLLEGAPVIGPYSEGVALALVVATITYLSLILGELVPKRIALGHPEAVARLVAYPMRWLSTVGRPLVWVLTGSTDLVLRLLRFQRSEEHHVTEDDIRALVAQGTAGGAVHAEEQEILGRVLHLGDRPVAAVMTPRTTMRWVDAEIGADELRRELFSGAPAWLLVCHKEVDDVVGVVGVRDLLLRLLAGEPPELRTIARPPVFVPEALPMLSLMEKLRTSEVPVAVVLDEFGGVQGMVTFTDLVTHLVGDLPTGPGDRPDIVRRADGSWLVEGTMPFDELAEELGLDDPADAPRRDYHTVAGFVLSELGHLPVVGEQFEYDGVRFRVAALEGQRICRVLATVVRAAGPAVEGPAEEGA